MTKKHFQLFADRVKADLDADMRRTNTTQPRLIARNRAKYAAELFASVAREANPRFDTARFLKACGL